MQLNFEANGNLGRVFIRGVIGRDINAESFRRQLADFKGNELEVRIDSCGGNVVEAFSIFGAIREWGVSHNGATTAVIEGVSMSAASYIMLACKTIKAFPSSVVMIHNVSCGASGNARDLERVAEGIRKFENIFLAEYCKRTGKAESEIQSMLDAETFMTAAEAKELGLVDEIISDAAQARSSLILSAKCQLETFNSFLQSQKANSNNKQKEITNMEIKTIAELISALVAFSEKVSDETLKSEIGAIIEAAKSLEASGDGDGEGEGGDPADGGKPDGAEADASRRAAISAYAKANSVNGVLDAITIDALAGEMSVDEYKNKAGAKLAEALKGKGSFNAKNFLPPAGDAGAASEPKAPKNKAEFLAAYEKLNADGRRSEAQAYYRAHSKLL